MSDYGDLLRKERRLELAQRAISSELNEYGEITFATKTEAGKNFPASDYAYVPDPDKPSTWKLRLTSTPGGAPDPQIVGAAVAALGKGFRGNKVSIPAADLPKVKAKVKAAWLKANPDKTSKDLPAIIASAGTVELAVTKTDGGASFPAAAYAYVPDPKKPSTWKLRLWATPGGGPDAHIVGAAIAALGPGGFRGNKVSIPSADLPAVKAKVKAAWIKANPEKDPSKDLPAILASGAISLAGSKTEVPWSGPITFEDELSGDNRIFDPGSVYWDADTLPFPFRWTQMDEGGHRDAVQIGRVDDIWRVDNVIMASGVIFSQLSEAQKYLELLNLGGAGGVSIDADDPKFVELDVSPQDDSGDEPDEDDLPGQLESPDQPEQSVPILIPIDSPEYSIKACGDDEPDQNIVQKFSRIRIRGLTAVDIPAFNNAKITLTNSNKGSNDVTTSSSKPVEAGLSPDEEKKLGTRWYTSHAPVQEGTRWYSSSWWAGEPPRTSGTRWYIDDAPIQEGTRWYASSTPVKQEATWQPAEALGTRWYANKNDIALEIKAGTRWYDTEGQQAGTRWYGTRWYTDQEPQQDGTRWYGTRWYADNQPTQAGTRWYSNSTPVREGTRWYTDQEPQQEGTRWYSVDDNGTRWYEDEAGTRWYDSNKVANSTDTQELGSLPPALKASLVKKLQGLLAKETDPKKKAALQAKIDSYK